MKRGLLRLSLIGALVLFGAALQANTQENMNTPETTLFDFDDTADIQSWAIVNDGVMGGRSQSTITSGENGSAVFKGVVSLENNGGFASTRTMPRSYDLAGHQGMSLRVRGDGKRYQFRLRTDNRFDGIAYSYDFATKAGEWIEVKIPFDRFVPVFRGRVLSDVGPVAPDTIQQVGFLIANKKAEAFRLEIDWIKAYKQ